jgi:hypothetical protein
MIEPEKRANQQLTSEPEESQGLLNGLSERNYQTANCGDYETLNATSHCQQKSAIPPIVRLAASGQLLVVLVGVVIDSILYNTFESVRRVLSLLQKCSS